jgi:hypothetical protein
MRHSNSAVPALALGLALVALPFAASRAESPAAPRAAESVKAAQTASPKTSIDRFSAVTTAMTPKDVTLRFNVLRWSDAAGRADVVSALGESDPTAALLKLPTLGHIWLSSSPVGFAVKYAHRSATTDGGERITFVTEKRLDHYEFKKWVPAPPFAAKDTGYGVVELYLDAQGQGTGSFSLAAVVQVDEANAQVSLADDAPRLLTNAKAEPKPYWERTSTSMRSPN